MNRHIRSLPCLILCIGIFIESIQAFATPQLTGREIMIQVDQAEDGDDRKSHMEMILTNHRGKTRIRKIATAAKDYGPDVKKIMVFQKPLDVKGTAFLTWEYDNMERDDDKWLYMPALRKVRRISGKSNNDYFMGSDFTYDDMGDRNVDEDTHTLLEEVEIQGIACWKIQSIPVTDDVNYTKRLLWVNKAACTIIRAEYFDAQGLIKTFTVEDLRLHQGFWTVFAMRMVNHRENHTTDLKILDMNYDTGISDAIFKVAAVSRGKLR